MESSVQTRWKGRIILVKVNEIGRFLRLDIVPALLEATGGLGLWKLLPRENKDDIPSLTEERHAIGKATFPRGPPYVYSQRLINPRTCGVVGVVANGFQHVPQLWLR
jgi:hypothetical protein